MIQVMQKDQKLEEMQINFSPHTRSQEGQKSKCRQTHDCFSSWEAAEKVMPNVREARERMRARRLHQTCSPVDPCAHV